MKYKYIFWDWNGTLLDDANASFLAVNAMLSARSLPLITFEQYRDYIDVPIVNFYEKVMDVSKESMADLSVEFNGFCTSFLPENPISLGAELTLDEISKRGIKQYIFSSSQNKFIEPYLKEYNLDTYFVKVLGANDCFVGSKAELTRSYILENGINPSESLFIGDMVHDSEVAEFIGADCVLLSSGHQCEKALLRTGRQVVSSFAELSAIFNLS